MTEVEKRMVKAILIAAKVKPSDILWMAESCPSLEQAREFYPRHYKARPWRRMPPRHYLDACDAARLRHVEAKEAGDEAAIAETRVLWLIEIALLQGRIDREGDSMPYRELTDHDKAVIDTLDTMGAR